MLSHATQTQMLLRENQEVKARQQFSISSLIHALITIVPNPAARKFPILQFLINTFHSLAATRNLAVVVFSQCVTKMRPGAGAVLIPTINIPTWEQGLGCRVVLFRDWGWNDDEGKPVNDVRLAEVIKAEGITTANSRGKIAAFSITLVGSLIILFICCTNYNRLVYCHYPFQYHQHLLKTAHRH